jgi:hypothetical protein
MEIEMRDLEQAIRERAYQLWAEGGYQEGHADAHWLEAQREILSASLVNAASAIAAKPNTRAPRKKRRAA